MRVLEILAAGSWDPRQEVDRVLIDYDRRFRRRIVLTTEGGQELLIDQPQAIRLHDGDGLSTGQGTVRVLAKPEPCMEIRADGEGALVRIAWHLGNRHLPVQLLPERIRIRADHVIAGMVEGLGGHVKEVDVPFDPEAGAYAGGHHHHRHDDDEDHHH